MLFWSLGHFAWDTVKNEKLKADGGISFEDAVFHIDRGDVLDVVDHPDQERYSGQRIIILRIDDYVFLVPYDNLGETVVLKTIIPSRRMTRKYLKGEA